MLPGKRLCAGETFARHMIFQILTAVLQNFTVKGAPGKPLPSIEPDFPGVIISKKKVWLRFEPRAWHSPNPHYRGFVLGTDWVQTWSGCIIVTDRDTCSMKRWNVSSYDWLNFVNLSVSLPLQLESLITLLWESIWDFPLLYILIFSPIQAKWSTHPTPELNPYNICWEAAKFTVLY
jgi:hypothetical protein